MPQLRAATMALNLTIRMCFVSKVRPLDCCSSREDVEERTHDAQRSSSHFQEPGHALNK